MRIFKTKWFTREARAHAIDDDELCKAIEATLQGKVDNLGGGVYKKRLIKIAIAQSSWQRVLSIGFTHFYTPNRISPISITENSRCSVS